jgi:hypothetical protein
MKNNCNLPTTQTNNNKQACIHCKEKYRVLIEQFVNREIGYKELKEALRIYNPA